MRWYRQHARELLRDEGADLVSFADEEVVDTAHGRDPRVRESRAELVRCAELVVLRRHDEGAIGDLRQRARREAQVFRADPDKGDGVRPAPALEVREDLERTEAVPDQAQRKPGGHGARVVHGGSNVVGLISPTAPLARAAADAAK